MTRPNWGHVALLIGCFCANEKKIRPSGQMQMEPWGHPPLMSRAPWWLDTSWATHMAALGPRPGYVPRHSSRLLSQCCFVALGRAPSVSDAFSRPPGCLGLSPETAAL